MIRYPHARRVVMGLCPSGAAEAPLFGDGPSVSARRMDLLMPTWRDKALGVNAWTSHDGYHEGYESVVSQILRQTRCRVVVALGTTVQDELGLPGGSAYTWHTIERWSEWYNNDEPIDVLRFPHPSGLNRHWNDPENRRRGAQALHDALVG